MSHQSFRQRQQTVAAYETLIAEIIENQHAEPYYLNFVFNHLSGRQWAKIEQMTKEISRFHGLLKRHVVRKPDARRWKDLVPVLIGVPDLPVRKNKKVLVRDFQVNDGTFISMLWCSCLQGAKDEKSRAFGNLAYKSPWMNMWRKR
jgi:hypothetical protein